MKCPKCRYITFDYLDTCPRCGKDMSAEKAKMNIFSVKPNTPFLLGSLTGDFNDSSVGLQVPESAKEGAEDMVLVEDEIYDDGSELDIDIEEEHIPESGKDTEVELEDLGLPSLEEDVTQEDAQGEKSGKDTEEMDLDSEDLELDLSFGEDEDTNK
jgi:hypothetical protein